MNTTAMAHQGRNIKRIREMLGIKQDALAIDLGLSQQAVSLLEQKEVLDTGLLERVAGILKVPKEAIENFDEEKAVNIIANTFNGTSSLNTGDYQHDFTFNSLEKLMELVDENKKLYERLLQAEKDKNELLQKLLDKMQKLLDKK